LIAQGKEPPFAFVLAQTSPGNGEMQATCFVHWPYYRLASIEFSGIWSNIAGFY
jgi:hypothetical protein